MASPHLVHRIERLTVVAGVLFMEGRVLVGQRPAAGRHPLRWEFPGGKVESGEDAGAALVRELREELGVETTLGNVLKVTEHRYPQGPSVRISFVQVRAIDRAPTNLIFRSLRWVPLGDLHTLDVLEGDRDFVSALQTGAITPTVTAVNAAFAVDVF